MIHGVHKFQVYTKWRHRILAGLLVLSPFIFLFLVGKIGNVNINFLGYSLLISFYRLVLGYFISLVLGVGAALIIGNSSWGDSVVPILDVMQNVPSFALIPVFALLFGYTDTMAIIFIATSVIWPILFYCLSAIRTARVDWGEAATVFGANGYKRIMHYYLPVSLPAIITGSIVGLSIGWEAVIGLEIIGFSSGIGILLNNASLNNDRTMLIAGIGLLLFFVFVLNRLIWAPLLKKTRNYAE
jgi:ABC-type nitrate/sulfonate/bicarbonate transport system permease component